MSAGRAVSSAGPSRVALRSAFARAGLRLTAWFAFVFYGSDWLAAQHERRMAVHVAAELGIPWWPPAYAVYFSVLAVPWLVPWLARRVSQVRCWERTMALAIAIAAIGFVLLPAEPAYPPPPPELASRWEAWQRAAQLVAGRCNLLPSLHVALSAITFLALAPGVRGAARALMGLWFAALAASVLLTHQHHVADVLSGLALALALRPWRAGQLGPEHRR